MNYRFILFFITLLIAGCAKDNRVQPKVSSITESVYASGFVKAIGQYNVYSNVSGILRNKLVAVGDTLTIGDSLFAIDNISADLNVENAELSMIRSQENMIKLKEFKRQVELALVKLKHDSLMLNRQHNLFKQKAGSKLDVEKMELTLKDSKVKYLNSINELEQAKTDLKVNYYTSQNNLRINEKNANNYIVKTNTSGLMYDIYVEEGESVNPQTIIGVIGERDSFLIEIEIDENDIAKVKLGQQIFVTMDSYKDSVFKAVVTKIYPIMEKKSGSFTVQGRFVKAPPKLYPRLTLEANILVNHKDKSLVIPREYLVDDTYVMKGKNKEDKVKVGIGLKNYDYVEILNGISQEDYIYKP